AEVAPEGRLVQQAEHALLGRDRVDAPLGRPLDAGGAGWRGHRCSLRRYDPDQVRRVADRSVGLSARYAGLPWAPPRRPAATIATGPRSGKARRRAGIGPRRIPSRFLRVI